MKIYITSAVGKGKTLLSAFDDALINAGIHNYNLLILSSVIPPKSNIVEVPKYESKPDEFGHRLYVVKAEIRSDKKGIALASGIGWYQLKDGRGFFVEHETEGASESEVRNTIEKWILLSLEDLVTNRGMKFEKSKAHFLVTSATVSDLPTSVLTATIYKSEEWEK